MEVIPYLVFLGIIFGAGYLAHLVGIQLYAHDSAIGVVFGIAVLAAWGAHRRLARSQYRESPLYFEQNGVRVDYKKRILVIKGKKYDIADFRGCRNYDRNLTIEVADMKHPRHVIDCGSIKTAAELHNRLTIALNKAGVQMYNY